MPQHLRTIMFHPVAMHRQLWVIMQFHSCLAQIMKLNRIVMWLAVVPLCDFITDLLLLLGLVPRGSFLATGLLTCKS